MIIVKYYWSFGDGTISNEKSGKHTYRMPGVYLVIHTVWNSAGDSSTAYETVYVFDWSYTGGLNVSKTDKCLRHAIPQLPGQGIGWAIYDDLNEGERTYNFPFPEGVVGCCEIIDENDQKHQLVIDSNTFRHFEIGLRDHWIDGEGDYIGTEIESEILFREHQPPVRASAKLKHSESHLNFKPWFKDRRGAPGYNAEGFRTPFEVDLYIRQDSSEEEAAVTKQIPYQGQLVYDRHVESPFLQEGVRVRGAPWRLVSDEMWFEQIDTSGSPDKKKMSEYAWADQFTEPLTWFPRSVERFLNYATGLTDTGFRLGQTTGPDGYSNSASVMAAGLFLTTSPGTLPDDFTLWMWVRNVTSGTVIYSQGVLTITLTQVGSDWELDWNDGTNVVNIVLNSDLNAWTNIAIIKRDTTLTVYDNYQLANTAIIANVTYAGVVTLFAGGMTWNDFRNIPRAVTQDAVEYAYRDVIENKGNATCPVF